MNKEEFLVLFLREEFDNIIKEFFGIEQYKLRFSDEEKKKFLKERIDKFLESDVCKNKLLSIDT